MFKLNRICVNYFALLKPRVMSLVVFTAAIGMLLPPSCLNIWQILIAITCIGIGAGSAGALNMWYDADIDAIMKRTKRRPIPSGKVKAQFALYFGLALAISSTIILGLATNWFAALFLAFTIFFYIIIYTILLKRNTPQNIVIGGAAGAFPPMVGYACATGDISWQSLSLFLLIFLWTPPHFWALSLFTITDYDAVAIPMLPNIKGVLITKKYILAYSVLLCISAFIPGCFFNGCFLYLIAAFILNFILLNLAYKLWLCKSDENSAQIAKKLFYFSLIYLAALFSVILLEIIFKAILGYSI